jgi:hypothetical protein
MKEREMPVDGTLKERVAKLLRLASNDGATEAEALNAMEKAQKLCLAHNIELASISLEENHGSISIDVERECIDIEGSGKWRRNLANAVAMAYGGECVFTNNEYYGHSVKLHVFAPEGVYPSIVHTFRFIEKWIEETVDWEFAISETTVHGRRWKNSWILGAVNRISVRLQENSKKQESEVNPNALVKIKNDVEKAKDEAFPNARKESSRSRIDGDAYNKGKAAGNNADLGNSKIGVGGQKALVS